MRIATWNVNSVVARLPRLLEWLQDTAPDAVCLQETKIADAGFPTDAVGELGYQVATHGDGRLNGVAILSRVGIDDVVEPDAAAADVYADLLPTFASLCDALAPAFRALGRHR